MTIERKLIGTVDTSSTAPVYVEDVFSTYLYTGNGATQTITNDINLLTKGGLVWTKTRNNNNSHVLSDTVRGPSNQLISNTASATQNASDITAFTSTGYTLTHSNGGYNRSAGGEIYVSWTFREQTKFFDILTYTGTGSNRTISHDLGSTPGMIIVKRTDTSGNWQVYHRSLTSAANSIQLNLTNAQASATTVWNSTAPTSSVFSVGTDATVNASGGTYVAYLFANDAGGFGAAGTDSVVSCGDFQHSAGTTVNLGWEPQFILIKNISVSSGTIANWFIIDNKRGFNGTNSIDLRPNLTNAESGYWDGALVPTATGFELKSAASVGPYIYLAVRKNMK